MVECQQYRLEMSGTFEAECEFEIETLTKRNIHLPVHVHVLHLEQETGQIFFGAKSKHYLVTQTNTAVAGPEWSKDSLRNKKRKKLHVYLGAKK